MLVYTSSSSLNFFKLSQSNVFICNVCLRYKNNWIRVERTREQHTLDLHMGVPWETVTLTALGKNKKMFTDMLEEGLSKIKLSPFSVINVMNYFGTQLGW